MAVLSSPSVSLASSEVREGGDRGGETLTPWAVSRQLPSRQIPHPARMETWGRGACQPFLHGSFGLSRFPNA